jgi:hypothetical protein
LLNDADYNEFEAHAAKEEMKKPEDKTSKVA